MKPLTAGLLAFLAAVAVQNPMLAAKIVAGLFILTVAMFVAIVVRGR